MLEEREAVLTVLARGANSGPDVGLLKEKDVPEEAVKVTKGGPKGVAKKGL